MSKSKDEPPILCLDFDGVVHEYTSGWKGATIIPDPPVADALNFIAKAQKNFRVAIYSSRSHQWGGRRAMKRWLRLYASVEIEKAVDSDEKWHQPEAIERWPILRYLHEVTKSTMDPWDEVVDEAARQFVKEIDFPNHKPAAKVSIDDRALTFTGTWPDMDTLRGFRPWNK